MFKALLDAPMREGKEGVVDIQDVRAPVFRTLLHFLYTDSLPDVRLLTMTCGVYIEAAVVVLFVKNSESQV